MNRMHRTHTEDQAGSKYSPECLSNAQNNLACGKSYSVALTHAHVLRMPNAVERRCMGREIAQKQNKYEQADLQCLVAGTRILASVLVHATSHFIVRVGTWRRWDVVIWKMEMWKMGNVE
jgi:hypothetical protein